MQSQSEIINTKIWNEEEIRDLILFAQSLRMENEELRAKIIAMDAYVKNGDAKVRQLQTILKRYTI
jgi:flagellar biosynthesis regulator FlaF